MERKIFYLLFLLLFGFHNITFGQINLKKGIVGVRISKDSISANSRDTLTSAFAIQNLKELIPINNQNRIVSFVLIMVGPGFCQQPDPIYNEGGKFNYKVLQLIEKTGIGFTVLFNHIKLCNNKGIEFYSEPIVFWPRKIK